MGKYSTFRNKNRGYMKLNVWEKAVDLFKLVYRIAFIDTKIDFKLRSQIVDSAQSVSANIAEGYSRRSIHEYLQHLYIALGSLSETLTRVIGLRETEQIAEIKFQEFDKLHYEVENMLLRLVESLETKRDSGTWITRISDGQLPGNPKEKP